jgi:hypothetical protein
MLAKQMLFYFSQLFLLWLIFGDGGFRNYLPRLALNHKPPDLSLPSTQDYKYEPQHLALMNNYVHDSSIIVIDNLSTKFKLAVAYRTLSWVPSKNYVLMK